MIQNYLTVIHRNLIRQFSYTVINTLGLAVGLSCSLLIFLYVFGEWNHDRGYRHADRIYRIGVSFFDMGKFANGPERLLTVLPGEYAGIETATRIQKGREVPASVGNQRVTLPLVYYTDTAYFHVFTHEFIAGTPLSGPHEMVLTTEMAKRYFGRSDVVGEVIEVGKERTPFTVSGIVEKPDFPTHLEAEIWLSNTDRLKGNNAWTSAAFYNYALLREGATGDQLRDALSQIIDRHVYPEIGEESGYKSLEAYRSNENSVTFPVVPLKEIYLKSALSLELSPGGSETNMYIFSVISFSILVLAAVNFVNLTTARASRRAKEVGIRKTLGTSRGKLIIQFLAESVVMSTLSMIGALFLSEIFLAVFQWSAGRALIPTVWGSPSSIFLYLGFSLGVGLLSGVYPAFYLTSFAPVKVLKGNTTVSGGRGFRNFLVVFQFAVSVTLIIFTTVVVQQLSFIRTKDLGFDQQNEITIDNGSLLGASAVTYKDELSRFSGVIQSSFHGGEPGSKRIMSFYTYQTTAMTDAITINTFSGDEDYVPLMGYTLVQGRNFLKDMASDTAGIILNETAVQTLDLGDKPIGAVVNKTQRVIGVVRDFHWESLRSSIAPTAIVLSHKNREIGFRLERSAIPGFVAKAEALWKQLVPDEPFRYHYLDDNFGELLEKERIFGKAIAFFTLLAIFISCLGLYGLAAFTAEQRTKEIGIRKVLGASVANIVILLNKNFTRLVLLAIVIAVPVSIVAVSQWMAGFAYKTPVPVWAFAGSALTAIIIAWITVAFHSVKAARTNPAETIQHE